MLLFNLTKAMMRGIKPKRVDRKKHPKKSKRKRICSFSVTVGQLKSAFRKYISNRSIDMIIDIFCQKVQTSVEYSRIGQSNPRKWQGLKRYHTNQKHA